MFERNSVSPALQAPTSTYVNCNKLLVTVAQCTYFATYWQDIHSTQQHTYVYLSITLSSFDMIHGGLQTVLMKARKGGTNVTGQSADRKKVTALVRVLCCCILA